MNVAPDSPTDAEVLTAIRHNWDVEIDEVHYFPAGFGAHHWRSLRHGAPNLFITLDSENKVNANDILEHAYAAASELAHNGFPGGIPPVPSVQGSFTVPLADGHLSIAPWMAGRTPSATEAAQPWHVQQIIRLLKQLHRSPMPKSLPMWRPEFDLSFVDRLAHVSREPWTSGPLGEIARQLIVDIEQTTHTFSMLAERALRTQDRWVPTHGEPHFANQIWIDNRMMFVDWETFRFAPPERDVVAIPESGWKYFEPDSGMIHLFQLEWTLFEIDEYADWFSQSHTGNQDDHDALEKLRQELDLV